VLRGSVRHRVAWWGLTLLVACSSPESPEPESPSPAARAPERVNVALAGRVFDLDFALTPAQQQRGLGGRTSIDPFGGMLFAYPQPRPLMMVMRDCPVAIDVAFLDARGRVLDVYAMRPEPPRAAGESRAGYEARLRRYGGRVSAQFAVEVQGGRLADLGVGIGDTLMADWEGLLRRARGNGR